jgi:hydrogenase expression/formation protein HypE
MASVARAGVAITASDTKVVERGKGDELYIITTGIGDSDARLSLVSTSIRPGIRSSARARWATMARPF